MSYVNEILRVLLSFLSTVTKFFRYPDFSIFPLSNRKKIRAPRETKCLKCLSFWFFLKSSLEVHSFIFPPARMGGNDQCLWRLGFSKRVLVHVA